MNGIYEILEKIPRKKGKITLYSSIPVTHGHSTSVTHGHSTNVTEQDG